MEKTKNNNMVIILLVIIIVLLVVFAILLATGTISFKSNSLSNTTSDNSPDNSSCKNEEIEISASELSKIGSSTYNSIKEQYNSNYSFKLDVNGKVIINLTHELSNITNAKDILLYTPPAPTSFLYVLTKDGDVYKYDISNYDSNNYTAEKLNEYSNIKKMFLYSTSSSAAKGGCSYLVLIDGNEKYYQLDSYCV